MKLSEVLEGRRSIRSFKQMQVPDKIINEIISAGLSIGA
jgi:nitroreductase